MAGKKMLNEINLKRLYRRILRRERLCESILNYRKRNYLYKHPELKKSNHNL